MDVLKIKALYHRLNTHKIRTIKILLKNIRLQLIVKNFAYLTLIAKKHFMFHFIFLIPYKILL